MNGGSSGSADRNNATSGAATSMPGSFDNVGESAANSASMPVIGSASLHRPDDQTVFRVEQGQRASADQPANSASPPRSAVDPEPGGFTADQSPETLLAAIRRQEEQLAALKLALAKASGGST